MSDWFVVGMGIGIVFIGLICIVILSKILSAVCMLSEKKEAIPKQNIVPAAVTAVDQKIENREEIIAAVSAVVAEELGTDISALRILSFKKI